MTQSRERELMRQTYLRLLGVSCWHPRFELPGEKTSRDYDWLNEAGTKAAPSRAAEILSGSAAVAESPHSSTAFQAHEDVPVASIRNSPSADAQPPARSTETGSPPPYFAFAYLSVSEHLAVLCEIPYQSRGRLQAPLRVMLSRILQALGIEVKSGSTPVIHFQWPLHDNEQLDQGMDSARQTVHGFLARQLKERPVPSLLVFSDTWPGYLFPEDFTVTSDSELLRHPQFPVHVLVTRSLHAMHQDESLKKPVWQQLQALRVRLQQTVAGEGGQAGN